MWTWWFKRFKSLYHPPAYPSVDALLGQIEEIPLADQPQLLDKTDAFPEVEALEVFLRVLERPQRMLGLQAVRKAVERSPRNAWTVLWVAIHHTDQWVRRSAIMALTHLRDPRAVPVLAGALKDESLFVRQIVVRGLGQLELPHCVPPLLAATHDPNAEVRLEALRALAIHYDTRISERLIELLNDPERRVVHRAAHLLNEREEPKILPLVGAALQILSPEVQDLALLVFAYHAALARTATLLPFMDTDHRPLRLCIVRELATRTDEASLLGLRQGLSDSSSEVRDVCFSAFAERNDVVAAEMLGQCLAAADQDLRSRAVKALGQMEVAEASEILTAALWDESEQIRLAVTTTLGQRSATPHRGWLLQARRDSSPQVRRQVVRVLATLRGEWVTKLLLELSEDPDPTVQYPALRTLIEQHVLTPALLEPYASILTRTMTDEAEFSPSVRKECARLLGSSKTPNVLTPLIYATQDPDMFVRRAAVEGLAAYGGGPAWDTLTEMVETKDPHILGTIALALGRPGDRRSAEFLIRAAIELTGPVAKEAKQLLIRHGFFTLEKLIEYLRLNGGRIDDLVREGFTIPKATEARKEHVDDEFIARIIQRIKSGNRSIRRFTLEQLQGVQDPRLIEPVTWCLKDDDSDIRQMAIGILARFLAYPGVFECLRDIIFDADSSVGKIAIDALGTARERRAVQPLLKALRTRSLERRASVALRRIHDKKGIVYLRRHMEHQKFLAALRKQAIERALQASAAKSLRKQAEEERALAAR
ncbi:MAG: HEAT repeat domain-containing protein [Elusimicrobia bacterium]|nr:HEAT repeat domain-containing protein [Elusimicrobiota bacterium]